MSRKKTNTLEEQHIQYEGEWMDGLCFASPRYPWESPLRGREGTQDEKWLLKASKCANGMAGA